MQVLSILSALGLKLRSNSLSFHEFRSRYSLSSERKEGLVRGYVVSRVIAANISRIKGPDGAIASVHSNAAEIFEKKCDVGTVRLFEFNRPQSRSKNLVVCPSPTPYKRLVPAL
ncbi:hypothetical protein AVEN_6377-1 [Araneus ventricosus]|uniref:Uncharacterized protein n=1 Tax=Araneus ventricosus TaxID=182803 RepID=A0A4Y2T9P3_ARAVE|nr:hypothetical protein AVEN_6377-1 [Araneus ventricosus]